MGETKKNGSAGRSSDVDKADLQWLSGIFKKVEIFDGFTVSEVNQLIDEMEKFVFDKGDVIFKEGDVPDAFYIVYSGVVKVQRKKFFRQVKVSHLGTTEFFGEMAFLTYKPRVATVIAEERTVCFILFKSTFQSLLEKNPAFKDRLKRLSFKRALELRKI